MFDFEDLARNYEENQEIAKIKRRENIFEEEYARQRQNVESTIRQARYDITAYMDKLERILEIIKEDGDIVDVEYGDPTDDNTLEVRFDAENYYGSYKLKYIFTTEECYANMLYDVESWITDKGFWRLDCGISGEKFGEVMTNLVRIFEPNKNTGITGNFEDLMKKYVIKKVKMSEPESREDFKHVINHALTEYRNMWLKYYYMLQSLRKFDKVVFFFTKHSFCVWERKFRTNLE